MPETCTPRDAAASFLFPIAADMHMHNYMHVLKVTAPRPGSAVARELSVTCMMNPRDLDSDITVALQNGSRQLLCNIIPLAIWLLWAIPLRGPPVVDVLPIPPLVPWVQSLRALCHDSEWTPEIDAT